MLRSLSMRTGNTRLLSAMVLVALAAAAGATALAPNASAQMRRPPVPTPPGTGTNAAGESAPLLGRSLRSRTGAEIARQLSDAKRPEDRRRAVARAESSLPDDEVLAFLAPLAERGSPLENDPRALLDVARGLGRFAVSERALRALMSLTSIDPHDDTLPHNEEYVALTRRTAAMAVAQSVNPKLEELASDISAAMDGSDEARLMWTAAFSVPRRGPLPSELVERLPLAFAAAADLRSADAMFNAAKQTATAPLMLGLARLGDRRALTLFDGADTTAADAAVPWTEVAIRLRTPKWEERLLDLLDQDPPLAEAVTLARGLASDKVVQKLGARAAFHPAPEERTRAIDALATMPTILCVRTLLSLALRDETRVEAFRALANHPRPDATRVLEQLASDGVPKGTAAPEAARYARHALRAYVARAVRRGERSPALDTRARAMLASKEAADRNVAAFALVATGAESPAHMFERRDVGIARATAAALRALPDAAKIAAKRLPDETDPVARMLLAFASPGPEVPDFASAALAMERNVLMAYADGMTLEPRAYDARERAMAQTSVPRRIAFIRGTCEGPHAITLAQRLADAYRSETDAGVRATLVRCLARIALPREGAAPAALPADVGRALQIASWSEGAARTRSMARAAIAKCTTCAWHPADQTVTSFVGLDTRGAVSSAPFTGIVATADGELVPVVFDDDGVATLLGVASEGAQLALSPRYE